MKPNARSLATPIQKGCEEGPRPRPMNVRKGDHDRAWKHSGPRLTERGHLM